MLALAALTPAHGQSVTSAPLADGVTHEVHPVAGSSARVHVARIAAGAPVRLQVVQALGGLAGGRETPSSMCRRTRGCRVALNGDFYTDSGPVGGVVVSGRMLRSPRPEHEQLSVAPLRATTSGLGAGGWAGSVTPAQDEAVRLDGVNTPLAAGQTVLYTPDHGAATPACTCTELLLDAGGEQVGRLDRPVGVTITGRGTGGSALPPGSVVLAGEGAAGQRLAALADATHTSPDARRLSVSVTVAQPTRHNLGAHPVLLHDGRVAPVDEADPMLLERHPRSVVGWNAAGGVWLMAFEGRQPAGPGPTGREVVAFLQRQGATDAVLLDGGGSTALATADRVLNAPSDGLERPVSNAVLVVGELALGALRAAPAAPAAVPVAAAAAVPAKRLPAPAVVSAPAKAPAAKPAPKPKPVAARVAARPKPEPRVFSRAGAGRAAAEPLVRAAPPAVTPPRLDPLTVTTAAALALLAAAACAQGAAVQPRRRRASRHATVPWSPRGWPVQRAHRSA